MIGKTTRIIFLTIVILISNATTLPKPHVARVANLGRTVVHLLNPYDPNSMGAEFASRLSVVSNETSSSTNVALGTNQFWPSTGDKVMVDGTRDVVIAEFSRNIGIKNGTQYTISQTLHLPEVGPVTLMQKVTGTATSSKMQFGLCAPDLGVEEQLFDEFEPSSLYSLKWHKTEIPHKDGEGNTVGTYIIDYGSYYFGSYFAGLQKRMCNPFYQILTILRRLCWNTILCSDLANIAKALFPTKTAIEKQIELCNQKILNDRSNIACDDDVEQLKQMAATLKCRIAELEPKIIKMPSGSIFDPAYAAQRDEYENNDENNKNIDEMKSMQALLGSSNDMIWKLENGFLRKMISLLPVASVIYLLASKPMPYPNIIYRVEYIKN